MNKMFAMFFCYLLAGLPGITPGSMQPEMFQNPFVLQGGTLQNNLKADQEVLFATNADCDLYINNELNGAVSKSAHVIIKLPPGNYTLKAKSKLTADELQQTFQVKEGSMNEIFIDLLYFIDEKNKAREEAKKSVTVPATTSTPVTANAKSNTKTPENTKEAELAVINTLVANMVSVKGGTFIMGNNRAPATDEQEHPVVISNVHFGKYEVTQAQWETVMGYNPSENAACNTCPVENVSWEEVMKFIRKINVTGNKKFRLPTEAEWEYVAKLGGREEIEKAGGQEEYIKKTAWYFANSDKKTHSVGQKQPNFSGIYDLFGNVSEWCTDWYGVYYYKDADNQKDPEGPPLGKDKVVRGGSFLDYTGDRFRPSLREKQKPTVRSKNIGFRLVMEAN